MNFEHQKKRQTIRTIIAEIMMVITAIGLVAVLVLVVSGYWVNSDLEIERQGLLQVSSTPTGADVEIDGTSTWFQKTNTSTMITVGEHTVLVSKDGYDTWTKTVSVNEGLVYRLHYPRLFPLERVAESMLDLSQMTSMQISLKHNAAIYSDANGYYLVDLTASQLQPEVLTEEKLADELKHWEKAAEDDYKESHDEKDNIILKFYDDQYLFENEGNLVKVTKKDAGEVQIMEEISFVPQTTKIGHNGEFVVLSAGTQIATVDMESLSVREWTIENANFGWLDNDMIYVVNNGQMIVYDYDGLNRREIVSGVDANWPAFITSDKYLYYMSGGILMREALAI